MAIKYNVVERGEPGVKGGGDIRAVLYALVDVMTNELAEGRIVRLGELGNMRVSLSSEGMEKAEDITSANITGSRILFAPGAKLKNILKTLTFEKV